MARAVSLRPKLVRVCTLLENPNPVHKAKNLPPNKAREEASNLASLREIQEQSTLTGIGSLAIPINNQDHKIVDEKLSKVLTWVSKLIKLARRTAHDTRCFIQDDNFVYTVSSGTRHPNNFRRIALDIENRKKLPAGTAAYTGSIVIEENDGGMTITQTSDMFNSKHSLVYDGLSAGITVQDHHGPYYLK